MHYSPDQLRDLLYKVEAEQGLRVIYGLESGSRAWGFESQNSDYDVRFLYVRPVDWYLCIEKRNDVLELGTSSDIDLSGWDLRKSLLFLRQSHPVLLEWLRSPVVYIEQPEIIQRMREIGEEFFAPRASVHHYIGWAERILHRYFQHSDLAAKRYFYVMRPILCCRWIQTISGQPPLLMQELTTAIEMPINAKLALENLIERKRGGYELDSVGRIPILDQYIFETLPQIKEFLVTLPKPEYAPFELLNPLFHQALAKFSTGRHFFQPSNDNVS
ncbi:nucleotidyltransferase domain-containing protein [Phormidesmis priestleyi ULC007]|uniref:Nucleotidyltransferase domain-containing protein n=1 Tax=Phormidesmis priestleyi ULC007 TaxID=1920490 RepID=A0A2T1DK95_9CYAN|nr:nucleotidyltransferase domain-containing protein [Phormidesmis priestleyi]PSB20893.1 nucleotidyltransferase domain-containing protein [Phormidesmis priestleyi ULC007]PZO51848.1 MAG: nucleotidyltransferase domain-containing protein [Phormidesmis priestleyi]